MNKKHTIRQGEHKIKPDIKKFIKTSQNFFQIPVSCGTHMVNLNEVIRTSPTTLDHDDAAPLIQLRSEMLSP